MSPRRVHRTFLGAAIAALAFAAGCAPAIGDSCSTSRDCSVTANRYCDIAQPDGYCTVLGCDPDTCPDGALCVEWRFEPARTAQSYCMASCSTNSDCRRGDGYRCVRENDDDVIEDGRPLARVVDLDARRDDLGVATRGFCAATAAD